MSVAERRQRTASTRWSGAAIGAGGAALLLLVWALRLTSSEDVNALKALVAVWLAALPVLGIGALLGSATAGALRRFATPEPPADAPPAPAIARESESATSASDEDRREERSDAT